MAFPYPSPPTTTGRRPFYSIISDVTAALQRVSIRWHLPYFDLSKTTQYIEHSLKIAGVTTPLFTDEAIKVIHEATQGAARAIGGLSCSCLLHEMSANEKRVDDHSVKLVLENEYR